MGRKARLKRERRTGTPSSEASRELRRRLAANGVSTVLEGPAPHEQKISDALVQLVQPLLERLADVTKARFEQLLQIAFIVWNADVLPDGQKYLEDSRRRLDGAPDPNASRDIFEFLLDRRRRLFSHDQRLIAQFAVSEDGPGDFKVSAAYAAPPPKSSPAAS